MCATAGRGTRLTGRQGRDAGSGVPDGRLVRQSVPDLFLHGGFSAAAHDSTRPAYLACDPGLWLWQLQFSLETAAASVTVRPLWLGWLRARPRLVIPSGCVCVQMLI